MADGKSKQRPRFRLKPAGGDVDVSDWNMIETEAFERELNEALYKALNDSIREAANHEISAGFSISPEDPVTEISVFIPLSDEGEFDRPSWSFDLKELISNHIDCAMADDNSRLKRLAEEFRNLADLLDKAAEVFID